LNASYRKTREKARAVWRFQQHRRRKKSPAKWRSPIFALMHIRRYQRPKNSHSRMITGIGTPNSQSRIPRPMFASFEFLNRRENAKRDVRSQRGTGKADL
jgi:hypothetical protein